MPVYFIQETNKPESDIKIGKAKYVSNRVIQLQWAYSKQFNILGVVDGYTEKELELHKQFSDYHLGNEWFEPVQPIVDYIANNAYPPEPTPPPIHTANRSRIKLDLFSFWKEKEREWQRKITVAEVARATGIHRNTIRVYLLKEGIDRPDLSVVAGFCSFFNIPPGPVPFLIYEKD